MEDRELLVQEVIERILKILPEVVGNLMATHALNSKLTQEFYKSNSDLKGHEDVIREVVSKVEMSTPLASYDNILKEALPEIRRQVKLKEGLSMDTTKVQPSINGAL
jgi:hypothetical protein